MAHWNHRVVRSTLKDGSHWYTVREVFYNNDGSIYAMTEDAVDICGETIDQIKEYTIWVLNCLDKDILIEEDVIYSDGDIEGDGYDLD